MSSAETVTACTEIDLTKVINSDDEGGAMLLFALAYLNVSANDRVSCLQTSINDIAHALFLVDPLQASSDILQPFLDEKLSSFTAICQLLESSNALSKASPLTDAAVIELAKLRFDLKGENLLSTPIIMNGYRCEACIEDRDERGFCKNCKCAVFCPTCYKNESKSERLDSSYNGISCRTYQKRDLHSVLKLFGLDWSISVFRVLYPALYLYQAHSNQEFVDVFAFKQKVGFDLKEIPKEIRESQLEIVKTLVPFIRMLVYA